LDYRKLKVKKQGQVGVMTINDPVNDNQMPGASSPRYSTPSTRSRGTTRYAA